ncbi:hypothetical protein RF11_05012 [Thelohanellus kitauei]|uniref:Uncharacterized protein n=1 Tax=Thelohanellus kitauei TaxID=669202 RepID=A0A0C2IYD0_THEKT|nr:hypothetical protein RF11_05012 [Thelohanellus kitauei]
MKMSPNCIQIRHIEGLDRPFLDEVFERIHFHKISPPLTPKGVWKLYVANRDDYFLLLTLPYFFGDTLFDQVPRCWKSPLIMSQACDCPCIIFILKAKKKYRHPRSIYSVDQTN